MDFNNVWISGRVVSEPVLGKTGNGIDALTFKMKTIESERDEATGKWTERYTTMEYVVYGRLARIAAAEIKKYSYLAVEGRLCVSSWDAEEGRRHRVQCQVRRYRIEEPERRKPVMTA